MSAPGFYLTPEQIADIRARRIVWNDNVATCAHIWGCFSWQNGVINWRTLGEPLGQAKLSPAGFAGTVDKLEAMARRQVEARIRELAAEIEQAYLTNDQEPNR